MVDCPAGVALKGSLGYPGRLGPPFLSEENRMIFIAGGALIGAGIASLCGQNTWSGFRSATHILRIEEPVHSRASRAISIGLIGLGVVAILWAVYREIIARA